MDSIIQGVSRLLIATFFMLCFGVLVGAVIAGIRERVRG
jgi:hypothetical protein